jgi:hypothetical protein
MRSHTFTSAALSAAKAKAKKHEKKSAKSASGATLVVEKKGGKANG